jgi:catechol 2,3-dioxygenase-like lactoylglutathione lyase family enzyme
MVRTYGLTHIALAVRDLKRAARFYQTLLGAKVAYRSDTFVQLQTPGARDAIVLQRGKPAGKAGGVLHFGFRLRRPQDIAAAAVAVRLGGGRIRRQGEFVPGEPYLFASDPDGHEVEVWYELPTPHDPGRRRRPRR